jgi:CRP/FNR family transcriptional regulator, anaerobic regulatory protein
MKEPHKHYLDSYLKSFSHFSADEIRFIRADLTVHEYLKGDFLFKRGDVQREIGFVCKGLWRRYYIDAKGDKITTAFINENKYATDYPAFIRQIPTKYYIEALEPSVVIKLSYDNIQKGYRTFKNSEMYGRYMAEKVLTILNDRIESFMFEDAEQRYLSFIRQNKDILNRVSLSHLCTYLGIKRQSLSRIRHKLAKG